VEDRGSCACATARAGGHLFDGLKSECHRSHERYDWTRPGRLQPATSYSIVKKPRAAGRGRNGVRVEKPAMFGCTSVDSSRASSSIALVSPSEAIL